MKIVTDQEVSFIDFNDKIKDNINSIIRSLKRDNQGQISYAPLSQSMQDPIRDNSGLKLNNRKQQNIDSFENLIKLVDIEYDHFIAKNKQMDTITFVESSLISDCVICTDPLPHKKKV